MDLPGYGYAHVAKSERADFNEAVADYLEGRENLEHTFVLIDPRLEPQRIDLDFLGWIAGTGLPYSLVFTKADKLSAQQARLSLERFTAAARTVLGGTEPRHFLTSSTTKHGRSELLRFIAEKLAEA